MAPAEYLKQHIKSVELKKEKKAAKCTFRDPHYKTHQFIFSLYDEDSKCFYHKRVESNDLYQIGYHRALIYRENCYHCRYAAGVRCSDLTIGDFSGLGRVEKCDFNSIDVSCVLVNTEKGVKVIESLSSSVTLVERPLAEALDFERQLNLGLSRLMILLLLPLRPLSQKYVTAICRLISSATLQRPVCARFYQEK